MKYLILLFIFISCGTSKTVRDIEKDSSKLESKNDISINSEHVFTFENLTFIPYDNKEEMKLNGAVFKNVIIQSNKGKVIDKVQYTDKSITTKLTKTTHRTITRERSDYGHVILGSVALVLIFLFFWLK